MSNIPGDIEREQRMINAVVGSQVETQEEKPIDREKVMDASSFNLTIISASLVFLMIAFGLRKLL